MLDSTSHNNSQVLDLYEKTFAEFENDPVIDIDKKVRHKFDMCVFRLEEIISTMAGKIPSIRQNCYIVVLVKSGSGEKTIGTLSFPIKEHTLYIVPIREVHSSNFQLSKCSGYTLFFDIDFFLKTDLPRQCITNRKIFKNYFSPYVYLDPAQSGEIAEIFESLLQLDSSNESDIFEIVAVKVLELLLKCDQVFMKMQVGENMTTQNPIIDKFLGLIDIRYREIRSVSHYALMLNIHPNHLNFLVKNHIGMNAKQVINNKIISEAKYLLSNYTLIIKEVSSRMGFDDPNNFSSFFQKCTGISPLIYRLTCPVFNAVSDPLKQKSEKVLATKITRPADEQCIAFTIRTI